AVEERGKRDESVAFSGFRMSLSDSPDADPKNSCSLRRSGLKSSHEQKYGTAFPEGAFRVPLPGVPPWTDQDIVLYHGTTGAFAQDILNGIDETTGGFLKDFGRGFYTTTRLDKA